MWRLIATMRDGSIVKGKSYYMHEIYKKMQELAETGNLMTMQINYEGD